MGPIFCRTFVSRKTADDDIRGSVICTRSPPPGSSRGSGRPPWRGPTSAPCSRPRSATGSSPRTAPSCTPRRTQPCKHFMRVSSSRNLIFGESDFVSKDPLNYPTMYKDNHVNLLSLCIVLRTSDPISIWRHHLAQVSLKFPRIILMSFSLSLSASSWVVSSSLKLWDSTTWNSAARSCRIRSLCACITLCQYYTRNITPHNSK